MGAKTVKISVDAGSSYNTLPGNTGTFQETAGALNDTIFGQEWKSQEDGILGWKVDANALYKGISGYLATIKKGGTPTTLTATACTQIGSSKSYQITDATKQVLDTATTVIVKDAGVDHTADVLSIDYLLGIATFKSAYTPGGAITITGKYLPMTNLGKAMTWDLKQTADTIETTDLGTAQANGGYSTFEPGLRTVTMSLKGFYDVTAALRALVNNRSQVIIEINPDGGGKSLCRGFFKASGDSQTGAVGALEEESTDFVLNVPDSSYVPFNWQHASTSTLNTAVQNALTSWLLGNMVKVQYLYDGTNGISGDAMVSDISLAGGVNAMNTFTVNFQGSGAYAAVGTG